MFNSRFTTLLPSTKLLSSGLRFWLSHYNVREIRGNYLYVLEDGTGELQFMREVETEDGRRGIVLKIEDLSTTYVGMYEPVGKQQQNQLALKQKNIPWQASVSSIKTSIVTEQANSIFNASAKSISKITAPDKIQKSALSQRCLVSLLPLLDVSYELQYGQLFNFSGCLGSGKTSALGKIMKQFNSKHNHVSLYLNPSTLQEVEKAVQQNNSWGFSNGSGKQNQTDVGVYMLALKTVHLATQLAKQKFQVLVGLDNFKSILQAEWHMLQLLNNTNTRKSGEFIRYSAPKIAPLSILNQLYAHLEKGSRGKPGSLTAIISTESEGRGDEQMPEVTPYSNNLKHLASLAKKIDFPLSLHHNYHTNYRKIDPFQQHSLGDYIKAIRQQINLYLRQKQESELKRKLYKSDMRDAPWDYYAMLDAEWWLQGLQTVHVSSEEEEKQFLRWILLNIQQELIPHWKIKCHEAFGHYQTFQKGQEEREQGLDRFISWAKLQGLFSPFKKDYLN